VLELVIEGHVLAASVLSLAIAARLARAERLLLLDSVDKVKNEWGRVLLVLYVLVRGEP